MSARERAVQALRAGHRDPESILLTLEAAGLRVIEQPEAAYDRVADGPLWVGDGWSVVAKADGEVLVTVADDAHPGNGGATYVFEPEVAAAISAAHIRAEDYR